MKACPFCDHELLERRLVAETAGFYLVADLHPLQVGHLLIIPRSHLPCYGALPELRDEEFLRLKSQVAEFLTREYGPPLFMEHGVAGQTVPHAHLHAIPGAPNFLDAIAPGREVAEAPEMSAVRAWYGSRGPYLYYEEHGRAFLLSPGPIPPGYLQSAALTALGRPGEVLRPDGADAPRLIWERWQSYLQKTGDHEIEIVTCFLWRGGRVCLFKRSDEVGSARGKWHGVSGFLPGGVDPLEHALIEIGQETGLGPRQIVLRKTGVPISITDPRRGLRWRMYSFVFEVLEGEPGLNWEHVELAWVSPGELRGYDCVPWLARLYERLEG